MSFYNPMSTEEAYDRAFNQQLELIEFFNGSGESHLRFVYFDKPHSDEPGVWIKTSETVPTGVAEKLGIQAADPAGRKFRF